LVIVNAIRGKKVYLDMNIFIYAIEGYPNFVDELNQLFDNIDAGNFRAFSSELTLTEVLLRPLHLSNS
jgi:predicted nucleic acid-binding protein